MEPAATSQNLLIIFTRNPKLGKVKTRLARDVGDEAALDIYKFLLAHTHRIVKNLPVDKEVFYSEEIAEDDIWENSIFRKKLQQGKDLGEKMQQAFKEGFENAYQNIIIIGSDIYELSSIDLLKAFSELEKNEFVVGPAADGGYYLLGMRSSEPRLFQNKNWGSSTVLQDTLQDLRGKQVKLLETRNDVDVYSDIKNNKDFQKFFKHLSR